MALIFCRECGKQYSDQAPACPNCGCPTNSVSLTNATLSNEEQAPTESKVKVVFANIGFPFALISFIAIIIYFLVTITSLSDYETALVIIPVIFTFITVFTIPGMIFSIIGKGSISRRGKATTGLVFSIISLALSFLSVVIPLTM